MCIKMGLITRNIHSGRATFTLNNFPLLRYPGGGQGWGFESLVASVAPKTPTPTLTLPRSTGGGEELAST